MRFGRVALLAAGVIVGLIGLIWVGQGTGVFPYPRSSFMIDQTPWVWRGAAMVAIGLICVAVSRRRSPA